MFGVHYVSLRRNQANSRLVEQVLLLHHKDSRVVKLIVELHYKSPKMVKLEIGHHHGYPSSDQEMFCDGEASDGASPREF